MDDLNLTPLPGPNPKTQAIHKREVLWQITIPLVLVSALSIAVAVMAILAGAQGGSKWADISLIALLLIVIILSLVVLAVLAVLAYGALMLNRKVPPYAHLTQNFIKQVSIKVEEISDLLVEPVLRLNGWKAGTGAASKILLPSGKEEHAPK
jgi:uncharacterized membrane protein YhdT